MRFRDMSPEVRHVRFGSYLTYSPQRVSGWGEKLQNGIIDLKTSSLHENECLRGIRSLFEDSTMIINPLRTTRYCKLSYLSWKKLRYLKYNFSVGNSVQDPILGLNEAEFNVDSKKAPEG